MRVRLSRADDHVNWAAVAGALCAWDCYARLAGKPSASRYMRSHKLLAALFVTALTHHLIFRLEEAHVPVRSR